MKKFVLFFLALSTLFNSNAFGVDATPLGPPGAPASVSYSYLGTETVTDLDITWTVPVSNGGSEITAYFATAWTVKADGVTADVATSASCSLTMPAATLKCTITGLNYKTKYIVKVYAVNIAGAGPTNQGSVVTSPATDQTIAFEAGTPTSATYNGSDVTVRATATSGLPVVYSSINPTYCSVGSSTGVVHALKATDSTKCVIRASQDGAGSSYKSVQTSGAGQGSDATIEIAASLSATISEATNVQSTQATLNGIVPFSGLTTTPTFCVVPDESYTAPSITCTSTITVDTYNKTSLTQSSDSSAITAVAKGLSNSKKYWVWVIAAAPGQTSVASSTAVNFTTTVGPSLSGESEVKADVGAPINTTLTATSGSGIYPTWEHDDLPAGLNFEPGVSGATITGTATTAGTVTTWVKVTDSNNLSATWPMTFVIGVITTPTTNNKTCVADPKKKINFDPKFPNSTTSTDPETGSTTVNTQTTKLPSALSDPNNCGEFPDPEPIPQIVLPKSTLPVVGSTGQVSNVKIEIDKSNNNLNISGENWGLKVSTTASVITGQVSPGKKDATQLIVERGHTTSTDGFGFAPRTKVHVYLYSTPILLGILDTDATGKFIGTLPLPNELSLGQHHIQVNGYSPAMKIRSAVVGLKVVKPTGTSLSTKVFFDLNSSKLTKAATSTLNTFVKRTLSQISKDSPSRIIVEVVGFVQPTKRNPFPLELSTARAKNVADLLKNKNLIGEFAITGAGSAKKNIASSRYVEVKVTWGS